MAFIELTDNDRITRFTFGTLVDYRVSMPDGSTAWYTSQEAAELALREAQRVYCKHQRSANDMVGPIPFNGEPIAPPESSRESDGYGLQEW